MGLLLGLDLGLEELYVLHAATLLLHPPSLNVLLRLLSLYVLHSLLSLEFRLPPLGLRDRKVLEVLMEDAVLPMGGVSDLVLEADVVVAEHISSHAYQVLLAARLSQVSMLSCSFEGLHGLACEVWSVMFLDRSCFALHFVESLWSMGVVERRRFILVHEDLLRFVASVHAVVARLVTAIGNRCGSLYLLGSPD